MDRARTPAADRGLGRFLEIRVRSRPRSRRPALPACVARLAAESHHRLEQIQRGREHALLDPHRVDPANLMLRRHRARVPDRELPVRVDLDEREREAVWVVERQHRLAEPRLLLRPRGPVRAQALPPPREAPGRNRERDLAHHPRAAPRRRQAGPRKEGDVGPRRAGGVRVEQVVRAGVVLVDAPLDEPHPEDARVEGQVLLRIPRDRGDVMDPVNGVLASHGFPPNR